jgi:hypothetical protein
MTDRAIERSAFVTYDGQWEYVRMPFGPTGAPATFQRAMNGVFKKLIGKSVFVYIDDVTIYTKTFDDHLRVLRQVLECLREHRLFLKPKKCTIAASSINLLGHVVDRDRIKTAASKVEAVTKFPEPTNRTEVRAFMGLVNYYRHFIRGCAGIAEPINRLLRKDQEFRWSNKAQQAFDELKKRLTEAPVLARPDFSKEFYGDRRSHSDG